MTVVAWGENKRNLLFLPNSNQILDKTLVYLKDQYLYQKLFWDQLSKCAKIFLNE